MNMRNFAGFAAVMIGAMAFAASPAKASLIVSVESVAANTPSTNNAFQILLTNTGAPIAIASFAFQVSTTDLNITFTGADFSTTSPYILAGDSFDQSFGFTLNTLAPGQSMDGSDFSNSVSGPTIGNGVTVALGRVLFNVASNATPGPFTINFNANGTSLSDGTKNIPIDTLTPGQITITASTAVPEPATAGLFGLALIGLGWKKRGASRKR